MAMSRLLNSIVQVSRKYHLDSDLLVDGLIEASVNRIGHCSTVDILCRGRKQDSAMFLLTEGEKVVSQFQVLLELLKDASGLKDQAQQMSISMGSGARYFDSNRSISELRFGMKRVSVSGTITEVPPKRLIVTEYGHRYYVSNARITDDTGTIRVSLWDGQIDMVQVEDRVKIDNCDVSVFGGEPQLRTRRKSTISIDRKEVPELCITPGANAVLA
jgi:replication factor A1